MELIKIKPTFALSNKINRFPYQRMKTLLFLSTLLLLGGHRLLAQKDTLDPKKIIKLDDVVVSAQIEPQSIKKSIKNVQVISEKQIKSLGATNLGDVLNQYVNITVMPDGDSGRSTVSLFGLDASYFKVLVDNIPLVNEGLAVSSILLPNDILPTNGISSIPYKKKVLGKNIT